MSPRRRQRSAEEDVAVPPPSAFGRAMSPSPGRTDLKRRRRSEASGASRPAERAATRVTPADTPESAFPNVPTVGPSGLIDKKQYIRLLEQSLHELGFADLASSLEERSGEIRATRDAEAFERAVLDGRWDDAVAHLPKRRDEAHDGDAFAEANLVCLECLYEDQIRGGEYEAALTTLQTRIAPLFNLPNAPRFAARAAAGLSPPDAAFLGGGDRLRGLAALLMFQADDATNAELTLSGKCARECVARIPRTAIGVAETRDAASCSRRLEKKNSKRNELVLRLALDYLPPGWAPPSGRLETLVEQALKEQTSKCEYHNANSKPLSLYRDYACGEEQLPTFAALTLDAHNDEVWDLAFDRAGARLATASRDGVVVIWEVLADGARARAHETARLDVCEDVCLDETRAIKNRAEWYLSRPERDEDLEGSARDCRGTAAAAAEPREFSVSASDSRLRSDSEDDEETSETEEIEYEESDFPPESDFLPLTHVAWSHDGSRLVTCGGRFAKVWCARTGALVAMIDHANSEVGPPDSEVGPPPTVTGAFFFDRKHGDSLEDGFHEVILTTTSQGRKHLVEFESSLLAPSPPVFVGVQPWNRGTTTDKASRIQDMHAVAPRDGECWRVVALALANNNVTVEKFAEQSLSWWRLKETWSADRVTNIKLRLPSPCMSLRLSSDGESVLYNLANDEIHLWNNNFENTEPVAVFRPETKARDKGLGKVVTRSCFGGAREQFVACGGADGGVHIWRRDTGTLLTRLECHATTVNAVCWNPRDPFMMATASDDFTVKIWTAPARETTSSRS